MRQKLARGFRTGDIVQAVVLTGKKIGTYLGRVAVRATGSFKRQTPDGPIDGLSWKVGTVQQRADGYAYTIGETTKRGAAEAAIVASSTATEVVWLPRAKARRNR